MRLQYKNFPGEPWIDTDTPDFLKRAEWVKAAVNATGFRLSQSLIMDHFNGGNVVNVTGNIHFFMPDFPSTQPQAGEYAADIAAVALSPDSVVAGIRAETDQPFDPTLKFVDPEADKPKPKDWEVPGAIIGPPLASTPGHFQFRHTGQQVGARITGASGRQYELVQVGNFAFFTMHAWRGL